MLLPDDRGNGASAEHARNILSPSTPRTRRWSGVVRVSCIFFHQGIHLILAYSWVRPAILVAGKGREGMFLFLLFLHFPAFLFLFLPCPSLSSPLLSLLSLFSLLLGDDAKMTHKGWRVVKPKAINQSPSNPTHPLLTLRKHAYLNIQNISTPKT